MTVAKAAIGPFIGAGLAFGINQWVTWRTERRKNIIAGNLALFNLMVQLSDLYQLRAALRTTLAKQHELLPSGEEWMLAKPIPFTFESASSINFESLAFLLEDKDSRRVLVGLRFADRQHADARDLLSRFTDSAVEIQKGVASFLAKHGHKTEGLEASDLSDSLGRELTTRVESQQRAFLRSVEFGPVLLLVAFERLTRALQNHFGKKVWILDVSPKKGFASDELPDLPLELARFMDEETTKNLAEKAK